MKRYLILFVLLLTFCGEDTVEEPIIDTTEVTKVAYDKTYTSPPEMTINEQAKYIATIETSLGTLVIDLYADIAPNTVNNFVNLSNDEIHFISSLKIDLIQLQEEIDRLDIDGLLRNPKFNTFTKYRLI